ncbi:hypothetical protein GCM10010343_13530 [Streptomyces avidinii]|nr:hypothetical protein GCM10010343_13530 [Streptomyces avidinii]
MVPTGRHGEVGDALTPSADAQRRTQKDETAARKQKHGRADAVGHRPAGEADRHARAHKPASATLLARAGRLRPGSAAARYGPPNAIATCCEPCPL